MFFSEALNIKWWVKALNFDFYRFTIDPYSVEPVFSGQPLFTGPFPVKIT